MNKQLYILLVVCIIVWICLGFYYFFTISQKNRDTNATADILEVLLDYPKDIESLKSSCKTRTFIKKSDGIKHFTALFASLDENIIYDSETKIFIHTTMNKRLMVIPLTLRKWFNSILGKQQTCWVVFIEDKPGNYRAAYEDKRGNIKIIP